MNKISYRIFAFLLFLGLGWQALPAESSAAQSVLFHQSANLLTVLARETPGPNCGEAAYPIGLYQNVSLYSLIAGFALAIFGILADKKIAKAGFWALAAPAFACWVYVNYFVDYEEIKKAIFAYNVQAEGALANIAEGQERYKSERGTYVKDLNKLYSHLAGAHGVDQCVKILELNVTADSWSAVAKHVSSPEKIYWDGKSGSSLKKG